MARRSIGLPLAVGIVLLLLVLTLAVGWQILLVSDGHRATRGLSSLDWVLLIAGSIFFLLVIVGLLMMLDYFTVLAGYLQTLTPEVLKSRL